MMTPENVQETIVRQDEDLTNLEEQITTPEPRPPVHKNQYNSLKIQIREIEQDLFRKKRQLLSLLKVPMHGRIVIESSPYNCGNCHNDDCLNADLEGAEGRIIRNQTRMNGCLAWLPPEEQA